MKKALDCLLAILENPYAEKGYINLKNCYKDAGMNNEAEAIDHLIKKLKNETNDVHSG